METVETRRSSVMRRRVLVCFIVIIILAVLAGLGPALLEKSLPYSIDPPPDYSEPAGALHL